MAFGSLSLSSHKFYMSITSLEYNAQTDALEIVIKFFTDDLEAALQNSTSEKLFIATDKEATETDSLLEIYLNNHLQFSQKNKPITIRFLGKEASRDYTYAYLEIEDFKEDQVTQVENTLLISIFKDQVNQVNYKNSEHSKSFSMHKDDRTAEF